jgi:Flp pilus assembly protein TadB
LLTEINHKSPLFCQKRVVADIRILFSQSILALIQTNFSALIIILSVAGVIIAATTTFCCFMLKRRQQRERERNAFIQKLVRIL